MTEEFAATRIDRYVVIGAGAVGTALAAGLQESGREVVLVSRGATHTAIRERGLRFTHDGRTRTLDVEVADGAAGVELRPGDVLVLAVKSQDASATLAEWAWRPVTGGGVAADLAIVLTQNGLDAERVALRYFGCVIGGVALVAARHVVPGEVEVGNAPRIGQLVIGAYPGRAASVPQAGAGASSRSNRSSRSSGYAEQVAADLRKANWLCQAVPDIERWLAWKVLSNVTFALAVLEGPEQRLAALRQLILAETRTVLAAAGHDVADPATELSHDPGEAALSPSYGGHRPSTWQSFARGAGSEVDYLNGEMVLLARLHGLSAPANAALQRVLGRSAALGEAPGVHHVDEVLALAGG
ncbi:MAG: 2-dehydropantoate 2-reductase N-terminal domain-containing protein [Nocardioides sp.]|uniref:ketopantoate reductase family protein n=1 Tax=Nocardioides sp. TaxID=35761 RepID=UPI0039E67E4A